MAAELFKSMTDTDILHVPYKGSTLAHPDLLGGRVSMIFDTITAIIPHVQSGALKPLAVPFRAVRRPRSASSSRLKTSNGLRWPRTPASSPTNEFFLPSAGGTRPAPEPPPHSHLLCLKNTAGSKKGLFIMT
jgi:hypothetical protein